MAVTLRALETAVPRTALIQSEVRDVFASQPDLTRLAQRLVTASFDASGIERRYTVIDELTFDRQADQPRFFDRDRRLLLKPGTRVRNELYIDRGGKLFVEAARKAIDACQDVGTHDITHVITVSCTGFFAPGPDYLIVRELGLGADVQRYHLGFMGCYATMPALRMAKQMCEADPDAVVLVVSAELCSLHVRSSTDPDQIVAASLFGDGAGAAIVSHRPPQPSERAFDLDAFETVITPVGEADMAWKIGDEGFEMVLSSYVPHIIDDHIESAIAPLLSGGDTSREDVAHWAIHPGGRSILDKVEAKLELSEAQLVPSRQTLRDYGNMSSATVLFVLKQILEAPETTSGERVLAMAFGPGLTVETALMTVA